MRKILGFVVILLALSLCAFNIVFDVETPTGAPRRPELIITAETEPPADEMAIVIPEAETADPEEPSVTILNKANQVFFDTFEKMEATVPYKVIVPLETAIILILVILLIRKKSKKNPKKVNTNKSEIISFCEQGQRDYQEDRVWFDQNDNNICAILADGMGGMDNGAESAQIAVDTFQVNFKAISQSSSISAELKNIAEEANTAIYLRNEDRGLFGGATLAGVFIQNDRLYWISAGDSHIYLQRNGMLARINAEHELENRLYQRIIDNNEPLDIITVTPESELRKLTSNLGRERIPQLDRNETAFQLQPGDRILIASDGIDSGATERVLSKALSAKSISACRDQILDAVSKAGDPGQDNYSGIIITYGGK